MASSIMADFGDHKYIKKITLHLNINRRQPVYMDVMIYLHNLGDGESEKPYVHQLASLNNYG